MNREVKAVFDGRCCIRFGGPVHRLGPADVGADDRQARCGFGRVAVDGAEQAGGWSVDTTTGVVTFATAPAAGIGVTAGSAFDVPFRFDTDHLDLALDLERLGAITSIPLIELRR